MDHPTDQPLWHIQRPIIASFLLAFGLLVAIFLFSLHWMHTEEEENFSNNFRHQTNDLLQLLIHENSAMEGQLLGLARDQEIIKQFLAGERDKLLKTAATLLTRWKQRQKITHLYFADTERIVFLRAYDPGKFGDRIDRQTMRLAQTTGKPAYGLELGSKGTLTLRMVVPWEVNGKVIGYLEIGKEFSAIMASISKTLHSQLYLFIHKKFLDQTAWQSWRTLQGQSADWDRFPDVVFAGSTTHDMPPELATIIQENSWDSGTLPDKNPDNDAPNHIHYFSTPILDIASQNVARMVTLFQDRPLEISTRTHKKRVIFGIAFIALLLGLLFNHWLLRVERNLRRATTELRHSEQRIRAIMDTALDAIISIDTNGNILEFNRAAERIFGFCREDVLGKDISETIIPPELREPHRRGLARYLATGERRVINQHTELEAINAGGVRLPTEIAITVIPGATFTFFTAFLRDISERKQLLTSLNDAITAAETNNQELRREVSHHEQTLAQLQASEERFRSVTLSIRDAIIAADHNQKIVFWNRGAEVLFGYTKAEIVGQELARLIPVHYSAAHKQGFQRFLEQGYARLLGKTSELSGLRKNGQEFPLEMSLDSWIGNDGMPIFSAIIRDITERKNTAEALLAAKKNAEAANQAKSLFLANMSHEIRTPMNTIIGMGYLLSQTPLKPDQQAQMRKIQFAAETLLGIINDILDFSKIEAGKLELEHAPFDLGEVMEKVASMVSTRADEKGLEILFALHPDIPRTFVGDALRLEQILVNLGTNAVKFTQAGEITFHIVPVKRSDNTIWLKFLVQDSGIGLSEEQIAGLFQPFVQADASTTRHYGGTGLGLAICKNLVEMMNGTMSVTSTPGTGSKFSFTLPLAMAMPAITPSLRQSKNHLGSLRVLIVDDNDSAREILQQMAQTLSFETVSVCSGGEALLELERAVQARERPYDVVLLDWQMPAMNGIETARRIQDNPAIAKSSIVIMMTAFGRQEVMKEAGTVGISGFMLKPVTASVLLNTIMGVLGKGVEPLSEPTASAQTTNTHRAILQGARILVVEDHDINWQVARGILAKAGVVTERAVNGLEAITRLTEKPDAFDLILMDLQMPIMDGHEATRKLREHFSPAQLPIVAMTANAMKNEKDHCLALGMNDYLTKPINVQTLFSTLATILEPMLANRAATTTAIAPVVIAMDASHGADQTVAFKVDGINTEEALKRLDGDQELLTRLLVHFANTHAATGGKLVTLLENGEMEKFKSLLHGLKGVAGNISANTIAALAEKIEKMAKQDNIVGCQEAIKTLSHDLETLTRAIVGQLDSVPPPPSQTRDDTNQGSFPTEQLKLLQQLLEDQDLRARDVFATIQTQLARHVPQETLAQLKQALSTLEFATGVHMVVNLLNSSDTSNTLS